MLDATAPTRTPSAATTPRGGGRRRRQEDDDGGNSNKTKSSSSSSSVSNAQLQRALASLLAELHTAQEEEQRQQHQPPPLTRPSVWRTRRVVHEIRALASPTATAEYERELRGVLVAQECRLRARLAVQRYAAECTLEQLCLLRRDEAAARQLLQDEHVRHIALPAQRLALCAREEVARLALVGQWRDVTRTTWMLWRRAVLRAREAHARAGVADAAALALRELQQRRAIALGNVALRAELWRAHGDALTWLHHRAACAVRAMAALCARERQQRSDLARLSLLHLTVLYREADCARTQAMRETVRVACRVNNNSDSDSDSDDDEAEEDGEAAAAPRRAGTRRRVPRQVAHEDARQQLAQRETRLRAVVREAEHDAFAALHCGFVLGWRDVHHAITRGAPATRTTTATTPHTRGGGGGVVVTTTDTLADACRLLAHIELLQRRCIDDQARYAHGALRSAADDAHRRLVAREAAFDALYRDYSNGVVALCTREHDAFVALHRTHHVVTAAARALQQTTLLRIDEQHARHTLLGTEAAARLQLQQQQQQHAVQSQQRLQQRQHDEVLYMHSRQQHALQQQCALVDAEAHARSTLVACALRTTASLLLHCVCVADVCSDEVDARAALLHAQDTAWQELQHEQQQQQLQLQLQHDAQQQRRRGGGASVTYAEALARASLAVVELHARESLSRRGIAAAHAAQLAALAQRARRGLDDAGAAAQRRAAAFVDECALSTRACAADELTARLHLVSEAELTLRAAALREGHGAEVDYGSTALWQQLHTLQQQQQQQTSSSSSSLLAEWAADAVVRLVHLHEPHVRTAVVAAAEQRARARLRCMSLELRARAVLQAVEQQCRGVCEALAQRTRARAREHATAQRTRQARGAAAEAAGLTMQPTCEQLMRMLRAPVVTSLGTTAAISTATATATAQDDNNNNNNTYAHAARVQHKLAEQLHRLYTSLFFAREAVYVAEAQQRSALVQRAARAPTAPPHTNDDDDNDDKDMSLLLLRVVLPRMPYRRAHCVKVWCERNSNSNVSDEVDDDDDVARMTTMSTTELRTVAPMRVAGVSMDVCVPADPLVLVHNNNSNSNNNSRDDADVCFAVVLDTDGQAMASTSLLLDAAARAAMLREEGHVVTLLRDGGDGCFFFSAQRQSTQAA